MYDDDARSASPSSYGKKDIEFASSFKEFNPLPSKEHNSSPLTFENKTGKPENFEKGGKSSKDVASIKRESSVSQKSDSRSSKRRHSRSPSRDNRSSRRSRSRSQSRSTRTRSPVRERHRSRSRDRNFDRDRRHSRNRSRSRDSKRRSRSPVRRRSRSPVRRRSRSRDRKRSISRDRRRSRSRSHDRHYRSRYRSSSRDRYHRRRHSRSRSRSRDRSKGRSGGAMTPQMALQQTMAAMSAKAQALTGIALPKYYNPAAVNPLKYAEQVQKRKLLWQSAEKVDEQPKNTVWDKLTFAQDDDGKMTAKFRKLMGIKSEGAKEQQEEDKESVLKKQEELFRDLDQQYEMARMTTHTQRGVGLGYSAQTLYPAIQK